jgi:hypothetical protein
MRIETTDEYREAVAEAARLEAAREGTRRFHRRQELLAAMHQYELRHKDPEFRRGRPDDTVLNGTSRGEGGHLGPRPAAHDPAYPEDRADAVRFQRLEPAAPRRGWRIGAFYVLGVSTLFAAVALVVAYLISQA